jgi:excisionase family DNA binding protein
MTLIPGASVLYQFTEEQFKQLLDTVRTTTIEEVSKRKPADKILTTKEAANYLRISTTTLNRRFKNKEYPLSLRHNHGGNIRFFQSELEAFLKK